MDNTMLVLCLLFAVTVAVNSLPYSCNQAYGPSNYKDHLRVPINCNAPTPSSCPRSWKAGVPKGGATSNPLIYAEFLTCHEGFALCGYVPINKKSGEVLGKSGVTVGAGVDLGAMSDNSPYLSSVSSALVSKLRPYFGLKRDKAACAAIEKPLQLTSYEATTLTNTVKQYHAVNTGKKYDKAKASKALAFADLPRGIRTAIVSVSYQFGGTKYPRFWSYVTRNDWENAVYELRHFYSDESKVPPGDIRRRNDEADIIEATIVECHRSIDAVILLDESGSVSRQSFQDSLNFVEKLIKAFPDDKLRGPNGTRFGLSTFDDTLLARFYLSSHKTQSEYITAINRIKQRGGGTRLGMALTLINLNQFTKSRGLRGNLPKILIVLTDGKSSDQVGPPADRVRQNDIVVYAIGIGNYDQTQLRQVTSPLFADSRLFTLANYNELDSLIATITATTCHAPQSLALEKTVTSTTKKDQYQYFLFIVKKSSNLEVQLNDVAGTTAVYLSRSNPHPYKYDSDIRFDRSRQKHKVIVIAGAKRSKRDARSNTDQPIYVSVQGTTELASFTIEGKTCDPRNCTEGTNERSAAQSTGLKMNLYFSVLVSFFVFYFY